MSGTACKHPDIRKFDGIRCCLACGEAVLETLASNAIEKNVDATGRHVYTHLNYQLGQEVRLILLAPGGAADPLCCEIVHVNLEDDPEYDAVSYTWATEDGNADVSKTIDCFKADIYQLLQTAMLSFDNSDDLEHVVGCGSTQYVR